MKFPILVRQSQPGDAVRALEIWRAAVAATHHFVSAADMAEIDPTVSNLLQATPLWVATDVQNWPVGFILMEGAHLGGLFVDPTWHRRGVGRALVQHALTMHDNLTTDVNEQNVAARIFYRDMGFVATGRSETDGEGRPYPIIHLYVSSGERFFIQDYLGDREALRALFLLADDSEMEVTRSLHFGQVQVAHEDGGVIGHIQFVRKKSDVCEIKSLAVLQERRRRGAGGALVLSVLEYCRRSEVRRVIVATGASDTQNLAFYQKRGFRLYDVVRDVFVPANGYPEYAAASTRDQVWLDLEIGPKR